MGVSRWGSRAALLVLGALPLPLVAQVEPVRPDTLPAPLPAVAGVRYTASAEYGHVYFSDSVERTLPWRVGSLELSAKARPGTLVGRVNHAERFGRGGYQVEADAYPRLARRLYAYLNAGFSDAPVFPGRRYGGELYASLPRAVEASLGARRLEFTQTEVTIYTGSLGKYAGNYYLSARPYVTPREDGTSVSGSVLVRRYFSSAQSYATFVAGAGSSSTDSPLEFELRRTSAYRLGVYGKTPLAERLGVRWSFGWEHEEVSRTRDRFRLNLGVGAEARF